MVTDPNAAPDSVAANTEGTDNQEAQPTIEELQERLAKAEARAKSAEGRYKSAQRSSAITGEALADIENRLANSMTTALKEAFETDDPIERNRRLGEIEANRKAQADLAKRITDAQPRLDDLVAQSEKDFSDPVFDEVRTAWDNGRPEEAIALARIAVAEQRTGTSFGEMPEKASRRGRKARRRLSKSANEFSPARFHVAAQAAASRGTVSAMRFSSRPSQYGMQKPTMPSALRVRWGFANVADTCQIQPSWLEG